MRKEFTFIVFGNNYRSKQFAAVNGVTLLCDKESADVGHPIAVLNETEVLTTDGWMPLRMPGAIDRYVTDAMGMVSPIVVLDVLCGRVYVDNFGFLNGWKPVNIPRRLVAAVDADMEETRMDPVISLVVMAGKATLRELEEYYSTEDVFKMYDMIAVDNLNKALGSEAAMAEAKSKRSKR